EHKRQPADVVYVNRSLAKMWHKLRVITHGELEEVPPVNEQDTPNKALVSKEEEIKCRSTSV
ncbi:hypothetical protein MTO96_046820, partial [Rhipicephalus appendiculatus]